MHRMKMWECREDVFYVVEWSKLKVLEIFVNPICLLKKEARNSQDSKAQKITLLFGGFKNCDISVN